MSKANGKIYKAYNKITKKSYIGLTTRVLNIRISEHYYKAKRDNANHFQHALNKYEVSDWEWTILEKNILNTEIYNKEIEYIKLYDSYNKDKGYNGTMGGEGSLGVAKKHKLFHQDFGWEELTIDEYHSKYGLSKGDVSKVVRGIQRHVKGWCVSIEARNRPRKQQVRRKTIKNKTIKTKPIKNKQLKQKPCAKYIKRKSVTIHTVEIEGVIYEGSFKTIGEEVGLHPVTIRKYKRDGTETRKGYKYIKRIRVKIL